MPSTELRDYFAGASREPHLDRSSSRTISPSTSLARNHVLTPEHARELAAVASVRNRIAHGYASVDPGLSL